MTVEDIIKAVRWCIDEEASNVAGIADVSAYDFGAGDEGLMNNIIKAKIGDALRWICLYAPADLLGGTDETETIEGQTVPINTGILVDMSDVPTSISGTQAGKLTLPADFVKLARVRVAGWYRAVKTLLSEDSDEYLQLYDPNGATATEDRPQAALIEKSVREIEVWPTGASAEYTYVANIDAEDAIKEREEGETIIEYVALPPRVKTSFIYYLAFLVLSAYEDSRAARMLDIAKMNIGKNG